MDLTKHGFLYRPYIKEGSSLGVGVTLPRVLYDFIDEHAEVRAEGNHKPWVEFGNGLRGHQPTTALHLDDVGDGMVNLYVDPGACDDGSALYSLGAILHHLNPRELLVEDLEPNLRISLAGNQLYMFELGPSSDPREWAFGVSFAPEMWGWLLPAIESGDLGGEFRRGYSLVLDMIGSSYANQSQDLLIHCINQDTGAIEISIVTGSLLVGSAQRSSSCNYDVIGKHLDRSSHTFAALYAVTKLASMAEKALGISS